MPEGYTRIMGKEISDGFHKQWKFFKADVHRSLPSCFLFSRPKLNVRKLYSPIVGICEADYPIVNTAFTIYITFNQLFNILYQLLPLPGDDPPHIFKI